MSCNVLRPEAFQRQCTHKSFAQASSNATFQSVQPLRFARDVFDDSCNGTGSGEDVPQQRIQVLRQGDELVPAQKLPKKRAFVNGDSQEAIGDGGADFDQPDAVQSQIPMAQVSEGPLHAQNQNPSSARSSF